MDWNNQHYFLYLLILPPKLSNVLYLVMERLSMSDSSQDALIPWWQKDQFAWPGPCHPMHALTMLPFLLWPCCSVAWGPAWGLALPIRHDPVKWGFACCPSAAVLSGRPAHAHLGQRDQCQLTPHPVICCPLPMPCSVVPPLTLGLCPLKGQGPSFCSLSSTWNFCMFKNTTAIFLFFYINHNWTNDLRKWKQKNSWDLSASLSDSKVWKLGHETNPNAGSHRRLWQMWGSPGQWWELCWCPSTGSGWPRREQLGQQQAQGLVKVVWGTLVSPQTGSFAFCPKHLFAPLSVVQIFSSG